MSAVDDVVFAELAERKAEIERLKAELATCRELREYDSREVVALREAHSWQVICLAYQGDTQPCATPCLHCNRISRALEQKP